MIEYEHEQKKIDQNKYKFNWLKIKPDGFFVNVRSNTLEQWFFLWEAYMIAAKEYVNTNKNPMLEIKYEDFLHEPQREIAKLVFFLGKPANEIDTNAIQSDIIRNNAYKYKKILALIIIGLLGLTYFRTFVGVIIIIVILYYLIRWIADIFWWGRNNDKW